MFQSTHPRRVWLSFTFLEEYVFLFQSTHPRRVWQKANDETAGDVWFQSTHPRRVWRFLARHCRTLSRFNPHTHAGCDIHSWFYRSRFRCFNPHTHAGCDSFWPVIYIQVKVSIHTPTQGVTTAIWIRHYIGWFQSTHPRRVWLHEASWTRYFVRFNPHTHAGCDR